ncbi:MAG: YjjG family noncanonical pyrimidine nucleotidase [Flavobacteriaceae bacterium]|nr:YjjG family noncanonical pyrimidine nucleotidase [Flavobacteriaceae bacterium]
MKLNHIRHVFFDLDHTLWDFDRNSALTFRKIFELNQIDVKTEDFIKIYEPLNLKYWKLYREDRISKENLRYRRLKDTFNSLEVEIEDEVVNKLSIDYIKFLTTFNHLFVGTVELLNYLSVNYKLHIITNGFGEAQTRKLSNSQLIDYFQTITNSEMVGVKKPNPRIFYSALEKAKAGKEESIMIGDSLEADIEGALNVGMDAIFFNFRKKSVNYGIKNVESLEDIKLFL